MWHKSRPLDCIIESAEGRAFLLINKKSENWGLYKTPRREIGFHIEAKEARKYRTSNDNN